MGAHLDPLAEDRDQLAIKFTCRRHFEVAVVNRIDQQALDRLARSNGWPVLAACQHGLQRVQPQFALLLLDPVALHALRRKNRPHFQFEECCLLRGKRILARRSQGRNPIDRSSDDNQTDPGGPSHGIVLAFLVFRWCVDTAPLWRLQATILPSFRGQIFSWR